MLFEGAAVPAAVVPVPAQVGLLRGDGYVVPGTFGNIAVAPGADVSLQRLIGLYAPHLNWPEGTVPHNKWR